MNNNLGPQNCYYRAKIYVEILLDKLSIGYYFYITRSKENATIWNLKPEMRTDDDEDDDDDGDNA
jgi:hypothetical protein